MNLHDNINVNTTIEQIISFLLDFEQYPKTELLLKILAELQILTQKFRKYFQLKSINSLINEMVILFSAAVEKEFVLKIYDIDLTLHILDLIKSGCSIECNDVNEIATITSSISTKYNEDIKQITAPITLFKKTAYLKFEMLSPKATLRKETEIENKTENKTNYTSDIKPQFIVADRTTLTAKSSPKSSHKHKQAIDNAEDIEVVNITTNNLDFNTTQESNFDIKEVSNLISMLKETVDMAAGNAIKLTWQQISSLNRAARNIKSLASTKSIDLIEDTSNQLDKIDAFINSLEHIGVEDDAAAENTTNKDSSNAYTLKNTVEYSDIQELIKNTIVLNDIVNYNDYINEQFGNFKTVFDNIAKSINVLKYEFKLDALVYEQIACLMDAVLDGKRQTEHFQNIIADKLMNAGIHTGSIYAQLSRIRSKPFADFLIGTQELVNLNAAAIGMPVVKVNLKKQDLLINADLWKVFDNIIPWMLRHIVLFNFDASIKSPQIAIDLNIFSGFVEILFHDNGKHTVVSEQTKKLREIIVLVQNAGGKTYINSSQNGTKIKFRFQQENILHSYIILENEQQYYGIPVEYYLQFSPAQQQATTTAHLTNVLNKFRKFSRKAVQKSKDEQFILIRNELLVAKLIVDKVVKVATLSPQRLSGTFAKNYSLGAAQFGNKSVLLLDVDAILKKITEEQAI